MGLEKREEFDHSDESVFRATGYSEATVMNELEPRAALLANEIMDLAGLCPTMAIEVLMDSPVLHDSALDNRDRALIILMTGPVIASAIVRQAMEDPDKMRLKACPSKHGFDHNSGLEQHDVLKMSRTEWDTLTNYAEERVLGRTGLSVSELVENMQKALDDGSLNPLQKAVVEGFVVARSTVDTAKKMTPLSAMIGPLAAVER